jgi:flagellar protein FlbB
MLLSLAPLALALYLFAAQQPLSAAWGAEGRVARPLDDAASLEIKRQQLVEREAALKAKEDALRRLSATLDARVVELNAARKGIEASLVAKKKLDEERYKKMIKIYKGLKSEEAGSLLNKLDDKMAIEILNQMDQKTIIKLIPFITQPRVLEWTRLNAAVK